MSTPEPEDPTTQTDEESQLRDLFSFSVAQRTFAVFEEDVEGTAESKRPARLPHAPPPVLGVVCVRGRMLTTLDPVLLTGGEPLDWPSELPLVIGLRGDEQLALAAESIGEVITIASADIEPLDGLPSERMSAVAGIARYGGEEITILNLDGLFSAAFHRTERRRRRF